MFANLKILFFIDGCLALGLLLCRQALLPHLKQLIGPRIAVLLLLTPAVALLGHSLFLFYFYLAGCVAFAGRDRGSVAVAFLLLVPTVPELPQRLDLYGVYLIPFSTLVFMGFGAMVGLAATRGPIGRRLGWYDAAAFLLVVLFTFQDARGLNLTSNLRTFIYYGFMLGAPYFAVSRGLHSLEQIERGLFNLCVAGVCVACVGIYEGTRNWVLYQSYYPALNLPLSMGSAMMNVRGGHLRVPGSSVDATSFGYLLVVILCAMPTVRHMFRKNWYRLLLLVIGFCLLLTQARGDWLGGVTAWIVMSIYRKRTLRAVAGAVVGVAGYLIVPKIVKEGGSISEALGTGAGAAASTVDYRKQLFDTGVEQFKQHLLTGQNPKVLMDNLAGAGLEQGQHIVDVVNSHLYLAMTTGLFGLLLWFSIWAAVIVAMFINRRRLMRAGYGEIGRLVVGLVSAAMVILALTSTIGANLTWLMFMLGLAAASTSQVRRLRRAAGDAPPAPGAAPGFLPVAPAPVPAA